MTVKIHNELIPNYGPGGMSPPGAVFIGSYSVNLSWPDGLQPGWYSVVTVTNLDGLGIVIPPSTSGSPAVPARAMWIQQAGNIVGGSRIGFANHNAAASIGTSGQSLYIHDSTHPAVFSLLNNPQTISNPAFRINVVAPPPAGVCCRVSQANCTPPTIRAGAVFATGSTSCNALGNNASPCCKADYNKAAGVNVQDIFDFLADWFAGTPFADFDNNGGGSPSVQSIFDYLSAWFGGC
jgi:hypothetical protein